MQNKPNLKDAQMNVSSIITMNYKIFIPLAVQKKQTQFKPKQTQSPKGQNEYKLNYNKGLQKKR